MSNITFVTHCQDELVENYGCNKLLNSFKYFHPELQIIHLGSKEMNEIYAANPWACLHSFMPLTMKYAQDLTETEYICHLDADSIVLDRLEEILALDYEVASVRNNGDNFTHDESGNRPNPIKYIPNHLYCNAGCISAKKEFIEDWISINKKATEVYGSIFNAFKLVEQDSMNILFHCGKFKSKIIDPMDGDVYYGPSSIISDFTKPCPESVKSYNMYHWQSWMDIHLENDKPMLYGKRIPLVHHCYGGDYRTQKKLQYDLFNPEFVEYIKKITGISS